MSTMHEDHKYLSDKLGFNDTVELTHQNPSGDKHSSDNDVVKE